MTDLHDLATLLRLDTQRLGGLAADHRYRALMQRPPTAHFVHKHPERLFLTAGDFDCFNDRIEHYVVLCAYIARFLFAAMMPRTRAIKNTATSRIRYLGVIIDYLRLFLPDPTLALGPLR